MLSVVLHRIAATLLFEGVVQSGLTVAMIQRQYIPQESGDKSVVFTFGEGVKMKEAFGATFSSCQSAVICSSNFIWAMNGQSALQWQGLGNDLDMTLFKGNTPAPAPFFPWKKEVIHDYNFDIPVPEE